MLSRSSRGYSLLSTFPVLLVMNAFSMGDLKMCRVKVRSIGQWSTMFVTWLQRMLSKIVGSWLHSDARSKLRCFIRGNCVVNGLGIS